METLVSGVGLVEAPRVDGAGRVYFSDVTRGGVYRLAPDGTVSVVVPKRRGVGGYHSNYSVGVVLAHDVDADGTAGNRRVFARVPRGEPDGLAVDEAGGVWVALGTAAALARFTPGGDVDRVVDVPADFVASLCFGGPDRRDVYVATAGALLRTRFDVPGLVAPLARV